MLSWILAALCLSRAVCCGTIVRAAEINLSYWDSFLLTFLEKEIQIGAWSTPMRKSPHLNDFFIPYFYMMYWRICIITIQIFLYKFESTYWVVSFNKVEPVQWLSYFNKLKQNSSYQILKSNYIIISSYQ